MKADERRERTRLVTGIVRCVVGGRATLIDWEFCGPTTVGHELGKSVLDLAGGCRGGPALADASLALLRSYAGVAGALPEPSPSWFSEWFMACSRFAAYNVDLLLAGLTDPTSDDRPSRILTDLLPILVDTAARWDALTDQLADLVTDARPA